MKIIDILNKKANGILEDGFKFNFRGERYAYDKQRDLIKKMFYDELFGEKWLIEDILNDTVEVIEENKEIEELKFEEGTYTGEKINQIADKLNELVRAVNKLTKERKNN